MTAPTSPSAEPPKPSFVLGGSKTFSLPMYGLMVGVFSLFLVAALALWAPEGRFTTSANALTQIVSLMLGLAGAGGITIGVRDAMTKGLTSSNSTNALAAIQTQTGKTPDAGPAPEFTDVTPESMLPED